MAESKSKEILNLINYKKFDVNEGVPADYEPGVARLPSGPDFPVFSALEYANFWTSLIKSHGLPALIKDFQTSLPPYAQSFAKISYMPNKTSSQLGVLQWPGLPPETLQKLAREMVAVSMIVGLRCDDVLKYAELSTQPWRHGWMIVPRDDKAERDKTIEKDIREAESFIENSGHGEEFQDPINRDSLLRDRFSEFLLKLVRDSLVYDGTAIWLDRDKKNLIQSYALIPAGRIRLLARPERAQLEQIYQGELNFYGTSNLTGEKPNQILATKDPGKYPFAVAVDETNNIVQSFTREDLIWYVRNPRVDTEISGYGLPEIESGLMLITGFNNALEFNSSIFDKNSIPKGILAVKGNFCYSEDTEVLTKRGWLTFDKVNIEIDEFATLNKENSQFEWQKASEKVWEFYDGTMYHFTSRSIDTLVTPNHWMIIVDRFKNKGKPDTYRTTQAETLYNNCKGRSTRRAIPVTAIWEGTEIGQKTFEILNKPKFDFKSYPINMSGDDYCAFMGMYLAEGSTNGNAIYITQFEESKGFTPYKKLLTKLLGEEPYYNGKDLVLNNAELSAHVKQYGFYANTKMIPEEILNATPRQLNIFWNYLEMGDGSAFDNNGGQNKKITGRLNGKTHQIDTTSKIMAGQLQEIACKMGYSATMISDYKRIGKVSSFVDKKTNKTKFIKNTNPCFKVRLVSTPAHEFRIKKAENYKGYIGCVTVANHSLYVRRNGRVNFAGNTQKQFDALGRIWDNLQRGNQTNWTLPALQISEKGSIELINLEPLRKEPAYYNNLINLFMGAFSTIYRMPAHRLGYKISGTERDMRPDIPKSLEEDLDVGLPALLTHIEVIINDYLLSNRWPHLKFIFTGKTPKEDARLYEAQTLAMSYGRKRISVGLKTNVDDLSKDATEAEKVLARIMDQAPMDPNLAGIYQTTIAAMTKVGLLGGSDEQEVPTPGNSFTSKKDPAKSEQHGHTSGLRRDSKREKHKTEDSKTKTPPNLRRRTDSFTSTGQETAGSPNIGNKW